MSFQQLPRNIGVEWPAALPSGSSANATGRSAITRKPGARLRCRVCAAVVECRHFNVLDIASAVRPLEFDSNIGKVHLAIEERQIVVVCPFFDLPSVAVRPAIG